MKYLLILSLFALNPVFAQSRYDYYNAYLEGFSKGCKCSNTPPGKDEAYLSNGSKQSGFRDGYIDGRVFYTTSYRDNYSDDDIYKPKQEYYQNLYSALESRQKKLDSRRKYITDYYNTFVDLAHHYGVLNGGFSKDRQEYVLRVHDNIYKYTKYDLSIDSTWNQIEAYCVKHIKNVLSWY